MTDAARTAIATAASTVAGINVSPYYRQISGTGEGMVRMDRTTYPDPFGGIVTWQVLIVVPQDVVAAERWLEAHQDELVDALSPEMTVRTVTPKELVTPQAKPGPALVTSVVVIEGDRERE